MSPDSIGVVLDVGSQTSKAGFAHENFPRAVYPTAVARFRRTGLIDGFPIIYCGKEAVRNRGLSTMVWPVEHGFITNWDEIEKLWHHTFYKELHVAPEEAKVMHSVHPLVSEKDKAKMAEIMFECFTVNELYLMKSPVLVLHANGRTSGVVWEGGSSCSYVAPVFEGFPLRHATLTSPLTGKLLSDTLQKLLMKTGYTFTTPIERDLLDDMKAEHCYVALDYEAELLSLSSPDTKITHRLPDGQNIILSDERIKCTEVLFKPTLSNLVCPNIPEIINASISKCDLDYRGLFYENIVLAGGASMFPGLEDRIQAELSQSLRNQPLTAKVEAMPSRQFAAWIGGSIIASLDVLKGFWLTKDDYEDGGPERVKYKFY